MFFFIADYSKSNSQKIKKSHARRKNLFDFNELKSDLLKLIKLGVGFVTVLFTGVYGIISKVISGLDWRCIS